MKYWITGLLIVLLGAAAWYYFTIYQPSQVSETPASSVVEKPPEARPTPEPEPQPEPSRPEPSYEPAPVEVPEPAEDLPPLSQSDELVRDSATELAGESAVMQYLVPDAVVSRLVASIDALTSAQVPGIVMPVKGADGEFQATTDESPEFEQRTPQGDLIPQFVLDPANYRRYTAYVERLESMEVETVVENYRRLYPLFQQAWRDLGYADGDFDSRLKSVIDELLATPQPAEPIRLTKPEGVFLFRDPELESLSAGQKVLIRMGPDNASRVKTWLRGLRAAL